MGCCRTPQGALGSPPRRGDLAPNVSSAEAGGPCPQPPHPSQAACLHSALPSPNPATSPRPMPTSAPPGCPPSWFNRNANYTPKCPRATGMATLSEPSCQLALTTPVMGAAIHPLRVRTGPGGGKGQRSSAAERQAPRISLQKPTSCRAHLSSSAPQGPWGSGLIPPDRGSPRPPGPNGCPAPTARTQTHLRPGKSPTFWSFST